MSQAHEPNRQSPATDALCMTLSMPMSRREVMQIGIPVSPLAPQIKRKANYEPSARTQSPVASNGCPVHDLEHADVTSRSHADRNSCIATSPSNQTKGKL